MNTEHQYEICNIDYDNELNVRMNERYFPSQSMPTKFDPRPMSTKYQKYPIHHDVQVEQFQRSSQPYFNPSHVFYTGNTRAPIDFAIDNVDVESRLRNQYFALQKNDQAQYIPCIHTSDLYNIKSKVSEAPKQYFENYETVSYKFNPDRCNLAPNTFNNSTRYNLKNL